ncbi:MAG: hypothetical protein KW793_00230 [Candidatus Doudnabacteria bacterium]|nr:hypothetical protein [Candidatus Doudnabacteria bacterium]
MYYYIIDPQKINQKHFERVQNQLYSSVSELKISGEMTRVTGIRTIRQLVETAVMRGATTLVAVGHDSTVQEIINEVQDKEMAIGYVPVQDSEISKVLGITDVVSACQALAHRRVEQLDLGTVQNSFFFTKLGIGSNIDSLQGNSIFDFAKFSAAANVKPVPIKMEIDGQFSVEFEVAIGAIFNSRAVKPQGSKIADPTDGLLDILLLPRISSFDAWKYRNEIAEGCLERIPGRAIMHGKNISIISPEGLPFYVGDRTIAKAPVTVSLAQKQVRMIIGKDRTF